MLASDADLEELLTVGDLLLDPPATADQIQPASIDLHLDRFFLVPTRRVDFVNPAEDQPGWLEPIETPAGGTFMLPPLGFALGSILQKVCLSPRVAAQLDGRSSMGRCGLLVHCTAGWIDPGFQGYITLELLNASPIPLLLHPGQGIGQLVVSTLRTPARRPYGASGRSSHYQHQTRGPKPSGAWRNWKVMPTEPEEPTP